MQERVDASRADLIIGCRCEYLWCDRVSYRNLINPNELQTPSQPSCVELKEPLSFDRRLGLLKILWTLSLAKGPYLTEKQDSQGTYYRAPPGGIFVSDSDSGPSHGRAYDGGFYVPRMGLTREDLLLLIRKRPHRAATRRFSIALPPDTSRLQGHPKSVCCPHRGGAARGSRWHHRSKGGAKQQVELRTVSRSWRGGRSTRRRRDCWDRERQGRQDLFSKQAYPYLRFSNRLKDLV